MASKGKAKSSPKTTEKNLSSFKQGGETFKPQDTVLMRSPVAGAADFVAKIEKVQRSPTQGIKVNVSWFYRPEEANGGRKGFHGERELFSSDHTDWCDAGAINGRCKVHSLHEYQNLKQITGSDYFNRFSYKARTGRFRPDRVPVYCCCEMPYNPDKFMVECEQCAEWYHPECLQLKQSAVEKGGSFVCKKCLDVSKQEMAGVSKSGKRKGRD
ncbi:hypothetical protein CYMTET_38829 [Cymbomonas tetramitiformis]|uniref:Uncharacterized protein n=1 Tax=Cymbomonas tetramitiformis TaxID=36881 RepID=A0AAE0CCS3_9CHLO|nr:hypothetical protein CYMTET_38829 [Cymbomonas tetramitiformis]